MIRPVARACISTRVNLEKRGKKVLEERGACVFVCSLLPGSGQFTFTSADFGNLSEI